MATWLVAVVTVAYAWTAWDLYRSGDLGHSLMFAAYAVANVGIILAIRAAAR